ncbi:MAG: citrate/2-methylcitrate synthase [Rubrivivax sp.]|nr:citrate/2-methylcitrate synthase [Rubrivivax sp.]
MSADAASQRLGVSKSTLYAYVSRGLLTAVADPHDPRSRRYSTFEVDLLVRRKGGRRKQIQQTLAAVNEGWPILDTALSCISDGQPIYRGHNALTLAESATVEDVARLLWQCDPHDPFDAPAPDLGELWHGLAAALLRRPVQERALSLLALAQPALQGPAWLTDPHALARGAAQHLRAAIACFLAKPPEVRPIHEQFVRAWRLRRQAADPLRRALVLAADHEMNMIAFVARALSSAGADMGAALLAAMCNLSATFNGGATERVESLWDELVAQRDLRTAVGARLAKGEGLPGFNHLAYPAGDPRAAMLLAVCESLAPLPPIAATVEGLTGWKPSIDFAFVALRRALGAPAGAALTMQFAGRCVGVIGHILEQRRSGQRIMTRARYVGPLPS